MNLTQRPICRTHKIGAVKCVIYGLCYADDLGIHFCGNSQSRRVIRSRVDAGQTIGVIIDELTTAKLGKGFGGALVTHPTTPPSAVTTQDSYTSHSESPPSVQTTDGVSASPGSDIDGDGDVDAIAIAAGQNSFKTFLNDGSGNFAFGSKVTGAPSGAIHVSHSEDPYAQNEDQALAVADIDGDGDADVITQRPGWEIYILF